jgi:hypothetical protein
MREDHPVAARPLCDLDRQHGETPNEDRCFTRSRYGNPWSDKLGTTSTIAFSDEHLRSLYYGKEKAVMSEIYPLDERDSSFPSQEDVESILESFELIEQNAKEASEYIKKGEYECRDLRQTIKDIRESVPNLVEKLAKHMSGALGPLP